MGKEVFSIESKSKKTRARSGILHTTHGDILTPAFIPVGTRAAVRSLTTSEINSTGAQAVLANTYHLWLQPGDSLIKKAGGLHKFCGWDKPIFTDSGGFQIFSLGQRKWLSNNGDNNPPFNVKISVNGVSFQSGKDGASHKLTPQPPQQLPAALDSAFYIHVYTHAQSYPYKHIKT